MCGIVGAWDARAQGRIPDASTFDVMVDALAHRGPDGRGVWRSEHVTLGHRRLAILDPTTAGAQPMRHAEQAVVVTYNGEIYNFRELREQLEQRGHRFRTRSDTEVLLAGYLEWGVDLLRRLNGIFAFGLFDERERRLLLARDPIGVKPLFYVERDGVIRFASELKALLADPAQPRAVARDALDCFLSLAYVPTPLSPFEGIVQLPPASALVVAAGGEARLLRYWTPAVGERRIGEEAALEELGARLSTAVERQMVSDVPLGAFLSAGLDSAAIVAEMVKVAREPVRTFSMGFTESSFDEREGAKRTADLLGTRHRAETISLDLGEAVRSFAEQNDDLFADASALAVDRLAAMTRREVTVSLSGDGADELLAGYPTYPATYPAAAWRRVPRAARALVRRVVDRLPPSTERYNPRDFALRFLLGAEEGPGRDFASWRAYLRETDKASLVRADFRRDIGAPDPFARYARGLEEAPSGSTLLKRMLLADLGFYLPSDMLVKVDRMSMRHGLEVRVPFLDVELVDFCLQLPSSLLLRRFHEKKHLLRAHLTKKVAPEIARRPKRGFNVPVARALRGELYDLLLDTVRTRSFRDDGPLDVTAVERLAAAHRAGTIDAGLPLYTLLILGLWWQRFLSRA